ncbi:MAG: DUF1574 domain-containing protein [Cytophagaceae bacterium]|jgi:hypothetical protein|nr:DUF1574 domain-containing protein [Cytophagaceae bacterium]
MKKFILTIGLFSVPALIYSIVAMLFMPFFLSLANGPSTKQQIASSFNNATKQEYELLILGNSRTYRGINPSKLNYQAYNFSHDNDSYNQMYYKLKYLIDCKKDFRYLILGTDYFQFSFKSDTRNYVYADFLSNDYMNDFEEKNVYIEKIEYYLSNINPKKILSLIPQKDKPFLRENGQYIKPGIAMENDTITRDISRLDFQVNYFKGILSLCKKKGIKVFITNLPTRSNELKSYTIGQIEEFDNFIEGYVDNRSVFYFNFSRIEGFGLNDFTDITHLNENAANRFTEILNKQLGVQINKTQE